MHFYVPNALFQFGKTHENDIMQNIICYRTNKVLNKTGLYNSQWFSLVQHPWGFPIQKHNIGPMGLNDMCTYVYKHIDILFTKWNYGWKEYMQIIQVLPYK